MKILIEKTFNDGIKSIVGLRIGIYFIQINSMEKLINMRLLKKQVTIK
jgi:hypothetical protein